MKRVLICGLPSSGNHLLKDIVAACGGVGIIDHGDRRDGSPTTQERIQSAVRDGVLPAALWPVRALAPWRASLKRRWPVGTPLYPPVEKLGDWDRYRETTTAVKLKALHEMGLRCLHVSYEGLIRWPEETVREICAFCGLEPAAAAWEMVRDENEKYG